MAAEAMSRVVRRCEAELAHLPASTRREVIDAVACALVAETSMDYDAGDPVIRYAAVRHQARQGNVAAVADVVCDALKGDEAAEACCAGLLRESPQGRAAVAAAVDERASSIEIVGRLARGRGGEALGAVAARLARVPSAAAARMLVPVLRPDAVAALRDAWCEAATPETLEAVLCGLVCGLAVGDDWPRDEMAALGLRQGARTTRRYALRLLEDRHQGRWLEAMRVAEFETALHLFEPALDTMEALLADDSNNEWNILLAQRALANDNPAVRKAALSRLLGCRLPWPFARDVVLPLIDDVEARKGKDFARDLDVKASAFCSNMVDRLDLARFACSRGVISGNIGVAARAAILSPFRANAGPPVPLDAANIREAADALAELSRRAPRHAKWVAAAVANIVISAPLVELGPAVDFAAGTVDLDVDLGAWLERLATPQDWARHCASSEASPSAVVASLAHLEVVPRTYLEAKGAAALVRCCEFATAKAQSRLWRMLSIDDIERLDEAPASEDVRRFANERALADADAPQSLAWRRRAARVAVAATAALVENPPLERLILALRSLRTCASLAVALQADPAGWRRHLARVARDATSTALCPDRKLRSILDREQATCVQHQCRAHHRS